jgi:hypothetical protein
MWSFGNEMLITSSISELEMDLFFKFVNTYILKKLYRVDIYEMYCILYL